MPQPTVEKFKKTAAKYMYHSICNFPQCLGAIDGKHVRIICPEDADTKYFNCKSYYSILGTAVAQWLRCCATNQKVAGSIPAGVSGFFIDIKFLRSHYGPGVYPASNRGKGGRCVGLTTLPSSCAVVM